MNATEIGLKPSSLYDDADRDVMRKWDGATERDFRCVLGGMKLSSASHYFDTVEQLDCLMAAIAFHRDKLPEPVRKALDAAVWDAAERAL